MISGKSVLALIPARAGSRRCPEKNWTLYKNKSTGEIFTLIEWAIRHAQASKYIDTIAISSDSEIILAYANPPIIKICRPSYLASDYASSEAVIAHALYCLTSLGEPILPHHDLFVLLQPTSPLRTAADIDSCLERAPCVSVTAQGVRNGAVYAYQTLTFLSNLTLGGANHYTMPLERSLDIDLPSDFSL